MDSVLSWKLNIISSWSLLRVSCCCWHDSPDCHAECHHQMDRNVLKIVFFSKNPTVSICRTVWPDPSGPQSHVMTDSFCSHEYRNSIALLYPAVLKYVPPSPGTIIKSVQGRLFDWEWFGEIERAELCIGAGSFCKCAALTDLPPSSYWHNIDWLMISSPPQPSPPPPLTLSRSFPGPGALCQFQ